MMFGNELAEIPYFNRFVTTNWDPFLERSLDILIPTVEDRDLAFWGDRKRQGLESSWLHYLSTFDCGDEIRL